MEIPIIYAFFRHLGSDLKFDIKGKICSLVLYFLKTPLVRIKLCFYCLSRVIPDLTIMKYPFHTYISDDIFLGLT